MTTNTLEMQGQPVSILVDGDIKKLSTEKSNFLIAENYSEKQVKYASYELRVSDKIGKVRCDNDGDVSIAKSFLGSGEEYISINPNQTLRLYTYEKLRMPYNILGRITIVGQVFSTGLFASSTFADPGFGYHEPSSLYITVINTTPRIIKLPIHSRIARIEFYRLGEGVINAFSGQSRDIHLKYENAYIQYENNDDEITKKEMLRSFSDRLKRFEDEDRCLQHFSLIHKSVNDESIKRLTRRVGMLQFTMALLVGLVMSVYLYSIIPDDFALVSLAPAVLLPALQFLAKETRVAFYDIFNRSK